MKKLAWFALGFVSAHVLDYIFGAMLDVAHDMAEEECRQTEDLPIHDWPMPIEFRYRFADN
jgi:hypothetical protein